LDSLEAFADLLKEGLQIKSVNIGGMHFKEKAQKLAEHVFLDTKDKQLLKLIYDLGISIETRAVPNGVSISVSEVLPK
jgi:mannose/fructose/N-acetylgalactosamine-specific phosphotransferase system component IIB